MGFPLSQRVGPGTLLSPRIKPGGLRGEGMSSRASAGREGELSWHLYQVGRGSSSPGLAERGRCLG